ncbi:MAG: hypothetical protein EAZ99_03840 [Alphaproteobacteria bacterium]|nr:MAG: hypothetical protein EAZ99_03840 [Alphaproteobacteria bacterium]
MIAVDTDVPLVATVVVNPIPFGSVPVELKLCAAAVEIANPLAPKTKIAAKPLRMSPPRLFRLIDICTAIPTALRSAFLFG